MKMFFLKALLLLLLLPVCVYAVEGRKTIAVLGFINTGGRPDDSVNLVISKSLTTFLSRIEEINLTPFDAVEKLAEENRYWKLKKLDKETALDMGLSLAVSEVITGSYYIDSKDDSIRIIVYVYDVATSELKLKRQYSGIAGRDLFDTIDKMVRNLTVLVLGHPVTVGRLEVEIASGNDYLLYVNNIFQRKLSRNSGFNEIFPAGQDTLVALRVPGSDTNVYSNIIRIKNGETYNITYSSSDEFRSIVGEGNKAETGKADNARVLSRKSEKPHADNDPRSFYFPVHLLEGGLGGEIGFGWYFTDCFRASLMGGGIYLSGNFLPEAEANISISFLKFSDFKLWMTAAGFVYFTNPAIVSPVLKLELSWKSLFIDGGIRYGVENNSVYPMVSFGIRI